MGSTQIVIAVNGRIRVRNKDGTNPGALDMTDEAFWASVNNLPDVSDPQVEYDRLSGRWIVAAINFDQNDDTLTNNRIMIAVSSGPTITSQSSFTFYFFEQNAPTPAGPTPLFADYPQMGVDKNAVYIGTNDFNSTPTFTSTTAFVVRKSSVLSGGPIVVTPFRNLVASTFGSGPFSPQPAQNMDPNVDEGYIVGVDNAVFSQLDVRRISNPGTTPSISGNLPVSVPSTSLPLNVPAQGSNPDLDALDDRLFEAMIARGPNGSVSLWTAHNIRVNSTGSATGGNRDRDGARWYEIGNLTGTPTLIQSGTLFDTAPSSPRFFWIPSIAMNGQGHASLNASTAGSGQFASVASSAHLATDPPGTTEPFAITRLSSSPYDDGFSYTSGDGQRWGDYSQTVVDPTDNQTFWTFQEYTDATNDWGVRVIKLLAPPPATPSSATPAKVPPGLASVNVQITGTSVGGSGFFDPGSDPGGPGYPKHISSTATGGVTINSVTYNDPTHVTLNLSTVGVPENTRSTVTVTNPDGQTASGTNLILTSSDVTPPETTIKKKPKKRTTKRRPKFTFSSSEAGSSFQCRLDSAEFAPCSSPFRPAKKLKLGKHVFRVRATDAADNVDPTPAVRKFKVVARPG